jgi:type I restriction enzyme S subunit
MNAERLLAHYEQIADAPDAIARLRRFILDLAVRGKLALQDSGDEPASELLKRSKKNRSQSLLKQSRTDKNATSEPEHDLPASWLWVRIGDHLELINGMAFKPTDWKQAGIKIVRIQNLNRPDAPFNYCDPTMVRDRFCINDGAFLISWSGTPGTSFGAFIWERGEAVLNQHIFRCDFRLNAFDPLYLRLAINGRLDEMIAKAHGGVGLQHITKGKLEALLVALPPLAEQHRIVAKVDELMALCDRLEATRGNREAVRDRLAAASLARLNAPDPETFQADARFALDALPALTKRPDQIKHLRQTILNLAVRGKLTPQDVNDERASELLKRIGAQTNHRDLDVDHELPTSWAWALIEECFAVSGGMQKTPARTPKANAYPYLGVGNVYRGRLDLANVKKFELAAGELERFRLESEDILVVEGNGSATEIGRCAVWHGQIENCVHQNHLIRCRPKELQLTPYAALYLNSPDGMAEMKRLAITSAGLFSLSVGKIRKIPFPLPPLAEQHRIVAKVDKLMVLCDQLEASLTAAAATRRRLLDALLAEALAPAEDREMEAAE